MGGGYAALSTDITRAVLGVPGVPLALLLTRSSNFDPFLVLMKNGLNSGRDVRIVITMLQTLWDPGTGSGWLNEMTKSQSPNFIKKQVLLHGKP